MTDLPSEEFTEWNASLDNGVATVELTHENSAINKRGLVELRDTLAYLVNQDDVGSIVFTGGPEAFCVGMDVESFVDLVDETSTESATRRRRIRELIRQFHASIVEIREARQPIIAAVDGVAAGGGFSLALACDLVFASPSAAFTHAYTDIGATADGGSSYFLPHVVGMQKAKELVFTPQPVSPLEMADHGVVNEVITEDFQATVEEHARELAERPSEAIARTKGLLNEAPDSTMEAQLERERQEFTEIAQTEEFERRVQAFFERRR